MLSDCRATLAIELDPVTHTRMMKYHPPTPSYTGDVPTSMPREPTDRQALSADVGDALRANLTRGYLESEERFRQIVEGLHDCVALTNAKGTELHYVNAAYERIWGLSRASLYADPASFLDGVHPDDRTRVRRAVFNQNVEFDLEFRVVRPSGEERWVWSRGFPVRDSGGEVYRIASITEDITDRKAIAASHERLVRGFTHDVKNPLGAADGYLSLLELGVNGELTAAQAQTVGRARQCIRTALGLVTQLLELERAAAGALRLTRERVDVRTLVRSCVEDFGSAADEKHQSLTWQLPGGTAALVVMSDRARLNQILVNLISNAVKYTQPGGRIVVSARHVDDGAPLGLGHCIAITVTDNGPGIAPEKQHLLFREFTRLDPTAAEGTGIGLAISQSIARALGAAITFTTTPGAGSTFTAWVPAQAPGVLDSPPGRSHESKSG